MVSQEQYELLQQMESIQLEQPNINSFKVIMDAMTAQVHLSASPART